MLSFTLTCVLAASTLMPGVGPGEKLDTTALETAGSFPFSHGLDVKLDTVRSLAFVSSGGGVFVVDVSDPASPVVLSDRIRTAGLLRNVWLDGTRLYVAVYTEDPRVDTGQEIQIWDIGDPTNPLYLGGVDLPECGLAVWARDSAMLATAQRGLFAFDVRDPADPVLLDSTQRVQFGEMIVVRDTLAFISSWFAGVGVVSVADPANLRLLAGWGYSGSYPGMAVDGTRLYQTSAFINTYISGLRIYDISDPLSGRLIGAHDTSSRSGAYRVAVMETIAVVTDFRTAGGFRVLSVADPARPYELGRYGQPAYGLALHRDRAFVAFRGSFEVIDLSAPRNPARLGSAPIAPTGTDVALSGGGLYGLGGQFCVLDLSGSDLELRAMLDLPLVPTCVSAADTVAAVVSWSVPDTVRLHVIGVSDPVRPGMLSTTVLPASTPGARVVLQETLAVVAADSGLCIYDLARPRTPRLVGRCRVLMTPRAVSVSGRLCAVGGAKLWLFDIGDPINPVLVFDSTAQEARDVVVCDTLLFLGTDRHLAVLNVAIPARPRPLSDIALTGAGILNSIDVDDTLLVGGGREGIVVVSVADPANPRRLGSRATCGPTYACLVRGDTVYTSRVERFRMVVVPTGIELEPVGGVTAARLSVWPSVVRRQLHLAGCESAELVDVAGRRVFELQRGVNDLGSVAPGIYFVRASGGGAVQKVVIQR